MKPSIIFEEVFRGISQLQNVHSKARLDIHNIESVFAAFEMAATLGQLGSYGREELSSLAEATRVLIAKTIEQTLQFPINDSWIDVPLPYESFAAMIRHAQEKAKPTRSVAVITFNYDVAIDLALERERLSIDYGLTETPKGNSIPLLKLHGSLNWRKCRECSAILSRSVSSFADNYRAYYPGIQNSVALSIGSGTLKLEHCNQEVEASPFLVPPTWNKTEYHRTLSTVWGRAARELRDAEEIYVMGYSLPPSDAFFRYLYALGTTGEKPIRRFWVFDPDPSGAVRGRFEQLLGPGAEQRFQYFEKTFEHGIASIQKRL